VSKVLLILINRTKLNSFFLLLLYITAAFQLSLYYFFKVSGDYHNILLETGHLTAIIGFFIGIAGVQFIITKTHAYDMGNLEMLGYSRPAYMIYYIAVSFILIIVGTLFGLLAFYIFENIFNSQNTISKIDFSYFKIFKNMLLLFLTASTLFYLFHSRKDPMLLVKERQ